MINSQRLAVQVARHGLEKVSALDVRELEVFKSMDAPTHKSFLQQSLKYAEEEVYELSSPLTIPPVMRKGLAR